MNRFDRITLDSAVMGGKACVGHSRVTVSAVVRLVAAGHTPAAIVGAYPYLTLDDVRQALEYAACRVDEREVSLP